MCLYLWCLPQTTGIVEHQQAIYLELMVYILSNIDFLEDGVFGFRPLCRRLSFGELKLIMAGGLTSFAMI